jgi:hypothetical protein
LTSDRIVAAAQVLLSAIYIGGYFWTLGRFLDGDVQTPQGWKEVMVAIIGSLTAGVGIILAFWFQRSRPTP